MSWQALLYAHWLTTYDNRTQPHNALLRPWGSTINHLLLHHFIFLNVSFKTSIICGTCNSPILQGYLKVINVQIEHRTPQWQFNLWIMILEVKNFITWWPKEIQWDLYKGFLGGKFSSFGHQKKSNQTHVNDFCEKKCTKILYFEGKKTLNSTCWKIIDKWHIHQTSFA
jgi:hypothetical protein